MSRNSDDGPVVISEEDIPLLDGAVGAIDSQYPKSMSSIVTSNTSYALVKLLTLRTEKGSTENFRKSPVNIGAKNLLRYSVYLNA